MGFHSLGVDISDSNALAAQVLAGRTFYSVAPPKKTGTLATVALDPALNAYPAGYHAGAASLTAVDADFIAANIKWGKTIFGIAGTLTQWSYDLLAETGQPAPLVIPHPAISLVTAEDHSGGALTATPALTLPAPPTLALAVPTPSVNAVGGAVQNDGGVETDETAAANNATANDMHIFPAVSALSDYYCIGYASLFDVLVLNVGTAGVGTYTISYRFSIAAGAWSALTTLGNEIGDMKATGKKWLWFNRPAGWAVHTHGGIANLYWIQFILTAKTSMTTNPLGTQAWIGVHT
jgi:hypothetical protein